MTDSEYRRAKLGLGNTGTSRNRRRRKPHKAAKVATGIVLLCACIATAAATLQSGLSRPSQANQVTTEPLANASPTKVDPVTPLVPKTSITISNTASILPQRMVGLVLKAPDDEPKVDAELEDYTKQFRLGNEADYKPFYRDAAIAGRKAEAIVGDPEPNFIEHFCRVNKLAFFQYKSRLDIDDPANVGTNLVVIDPEFGKDVLDELLKEGVLHIPKVAKEEGLYTGYIGTEQPNTEFPDGYNQVLFLDTARSHLLIEGQLDFRRVIIHRFGLDPDKFAEDKSATARSKTAGSLDANQQVATRSETLFSEGDYVVRAFRFEHAWVQTTTLPIGGGDKNTITAPGIFERFVSLCGAATGKSYTVAKNGDNNPTDSATANQKSAAANNQDSDLDTDTDKDKDKDKDTDKDTDKDKDKDTDTDTDKDKDKEEVSPYAKNEPESPYAPKTESGPPKTELKERDVKREQQATTSTESTDEADPATLAKLAAALRGTGLAATEPPEHSELQSAWLANALDAQIQSAKEASTDRLRAIEEDYLAVGGLSGSGTQSGGTDLMLQILEDPVALELLLARQRARNEFSTPPDFERVAPAGTPAVSPYGVFDYPVGIASGSSRPPRGASPEEISKFGLDRGGPRRKPLSLAGSALDKKSGMIADPASNTIIIIEEKRLMPTFEKIRKQLDIAPDLVEISVVIIDLNSNRSFDWGTDLGFTGTEEVTSGSRLSNRSIFNGGLLGRAVGSPNVPATELFSGGLLSGFTPEATVRGDSFGLAGQVITPYDLQARIQALEGSGDVKILARPSLLTVDGRSAVLHSTKSIYVDMPGEFDAELFKVNVPFVLKVTPMTVGDGKTGEVSLVVDITQSKSDSGNNAIPFVGRSTIHTSAILGGDESLLIGGRYRTDETESEARVPLIGKIPVLGAALKDKTVRQSKVQRLFLITPRIIDPVSLRPVAHDSQ